MKAKLIKTGSDYLLRDMGGEVLAITNGTTKGRKLSKQNCDEIFGVVDVEKLASENCTAWENSAVAQGGFKLGFNKAMELNKYTEEDIMKAYDFGSNALLGVSKNNLIQSLQQPTEIEVEIEMETKKQLVNGYRNQPDNVIGFVADYENILQPKLDSQGCLILKKI